MAVDRKLWEAQFSVFPNWLCPTCPIGRLALLKDTLTCVETGRSQANHEHDAWEPDWIEERFTAFLQCSNTKCGEVVAVGGSTHHVEDHDWEAQELNWSREYEPLTFNPAPPVFNVPEECPTEIRGELHNAFSLIRTDSGACANRLRVAVEALLTERDVPRRRLTKNKKWHRLILHERIEKFAERDPETADFLLAVKWLGNIGSHTDLDTLSINELIDGFELLEHVIQTLYVKSEQKMKRLAKKINSRKGRPARPKKKESHV